MEKQKAIGEAPETDRRLTVAVRQEREAATGAGGVALDDQRSFRHIKNIVYDQSLLSFRVVQGGEL